MTRCRVKLDSLMTSPVPGESTIYLYLCRGLDMRFVRDNTRLRPQEFEVNAYEADVR